MIPRLLCKRVGVWDSIIYHIILETRTILKYEVFSRKRGFYAGWWGAYDTLLLYGDATRKQRVRNESAVRTAITAVSSIHGDMKP